MIIYTDRLFLRKMNMDDFDALYKILADTNIMQHYPYIFDEERVRSWIERNMKRYTENGFGLWAVCLKDTGEMIGDCGLTLQLIDGEMLPEIGYHIRANCQRKGYAKEAAKAVLDWAFKNTDYPAFYSYCKYTNTASIKTAESIGMHFEKEYPDPANEITHVSVITRNKKVLASCGNDCASCPRYIAHPYEKTEEALHYTATLWFKIGYRDHVVTNEEISCTGCKPENWCRYNVAKCCEERGIKTCAECDEYPCANMKECFEVTKSFEPMCKKVCTDEEYEQLKGAFFEKEKNLSR